MTPEEWKGEHFDKAQGGAYLRTSLLGFKASAQTRFMTGPIQITLENLLDKKVYILSYDPGELAMRSRQIWKFPAGKFLVKAISLVDTTGARRTWSPSKSDRRIVIIRRHCLSNLGRWALAPVGANGLRVQFAMAPNDYREEGTKRDSTVAAVVDGFSGLVQDELGGKRVLAAAKKGFESKTEMRQVVKFTRQISMLYRLDLFKHNYQSKQIAQVLDLHDGMIRRCYTDALDAQDGIHGDLRFTFLLSKDTGTMHKLRHTGGMITDPKMINCVYLSLAQMQFAATQNMVGEIRYTYDVK